MSKILTVKDLQESKERLRSKNEDVYTAIRAAMERHMAKITEEILKQISKILFWESYETHGNGD